jgi:hypothetical protein
MSQRVWLVSVMAVALGVVAIVTERSQSQEENSQRDPFSNEARGRVGEASSEFDPFAAEAGGRSESGAEPKARQAAATTTPTVPRIWVTEDPERTQQLYEILKSPLPSSGLQFPDGTPLEEIIAYLREEYNVEILIDTVALDELGIGPDEPVSISVSNIRLDQAMRRMLDPLDSTYVLEDGVLIITSEEKAQTKLTVAIYDVRDLLLKGDFDPLIDIITSTIAPDTWAENGGGEAEVRVYPQRGSIVVSQSMSVHEAIAGLLMAMRELPVDPSAERNVMEVQGQISLGNPGHGPSYGSKASQQQGLVLPSNGAPH